MFIIKNIIFLIFAAILFVYTIRKSDDWSRKIQKNHLKGDKQDVLGFNNWWKSNTSLNISKFGIIFSSIILILLAYGVLFGSGS